MANRNELEAIVTLLANDGGLERSIMNGLRGLQAMVKVSAKLQENLAAASKQLRQSRLAEKVQAQAAPNERAILRTQRTSNDVVKANQVLRDMLALGSGRSPQQLLAGQIARREQGLLELTGTRRASAAQQLSRAGELQNLLRQADKQQAQVVRSISRLGPLSPENKAVYDKLLGQFGDLQKRLAGNIQRGRFGPASQNLVGQLGGITDQLRGLPASERATRQAALAAERAALNERLALNRKGIKMLEQQQAAEARDATKRYEKWKRERDKIDADNLRERKALNRRGIRILEQQQAAEAKAQQRADKATLTKARAASPEGRREAAIVTREKVNEHLFGDGGVNFAGRVFQSYGIFQAVNALYGAIFGTLGVLKDFDAELANLQGIAAATDTEMRQLATTILDVSSNSRYSVTDLAKASTTLAQAGFSIKEIQDSLQSFAQLATASGSTLAESVDVGTAALGAFQLRAEDASHVADVMASSLNLTKLTMEKLGLGLQYVGNTAYESNLSLEETVALLGGLSQAGIRSGSTLGTGLRQFIVDLQDPTKKLIEVMDRLGLTTDDIDIKMHGLTGVLVNLRKAGFSSADAFKGLETRAASAYLALRNQTEIIQQLERQLLAEGAAAQAAAAQMDSFGAQSAEVLNNLSVIAIRATAPLVDALTAGLSVLNGWFSVLNDSQNSTAVTVAGMTALGVVVAATAGGIKSLIGAYLANRASVLELARANRILAVEAQIAAGTLTGEAAAAARAGAAAAGAATGVGLLGRAFNFLGGPIGIAIGALTVFLPLLVEFGDASGSAAQRLDELKTEANATKGDIDSYGQTITLVEKELLRLSNRSSELKNNKAALATEVIRLSQQFKGLGEMLQSVTVDYDNVIAAVQRYIKVQRQKQSAEFVTATTTSFDIIETNRQILAGLSRKYQPPPGFNPNAPAGAQVWGWLSARRPAPAGSAEEKAIDLMTGRLRVAEGRVPGKGEISELAASSLVAELSKELGRNSSVTKDLRTWLAARSAEAAEVEANQTRRLQRNSDLFLQDPQSIARENNVTNLRAKFFNKEVSRGDAISQLRGQLKSIDADIADPKNADLGVQSALGILRNKTNDFLQELIAGIETVKDNTKNRNKKFIREASDMELKALEAEGKLPQNYADYVKQKDELKAAVKRYAEAKLQEAQDTIEAKGLTGEKAKWVMDQAKSDAEDRGRQFYAKIGTAVQRGTDAMFEAAMAGIEEAKSAATLAGRSAVSNLQGQLSGFDRPGLRNSVGDYHKQFLQMKIDGLEAANVKADIIATEAQIAEVMKRVNDLSQQAKDENPAISVDAKKNLSETLKQLDELKIKLEGLRGYDMAALPASFRENLEQAAAVWRENNDASLDFTQYIEKNLGGAFQSATDAGEEFFSSILTGSNTVLGAFANFAKQMLAILANLVAKFAVTKLFDAILTAVGAPATPTGVGAPITYTYDGGYVAEKVKGYASGGRVSNGLRSRDSVLAKLAKDEFVVRNRAVDSLGVDFMNDLNRRGAAAVRDRTRPTTMVFPTASPPNVYVMLPEEKPNLGPNDVIAIVSRDYLDGGVTRKLLNPRGSN